MSQEKTPLQIESLHDELFRLEPKIDLLHDLLGFGRYAEVHWDGSVFMGRSHGDIGFNEFLGTPSEASLTRTKALVSRMSPGNKAKAIAALRRFGIVIEPDPVFTVLEETGTMSILEMWRARSQSPQYQVNIYSLGPNEWRVKTKFIG